VRALSIILGTHHQEPDSDNFFTCPTTSPFHILFLPAYGLGAHKISHEKNLSLYIFGRTI